jgi:hypothetical protein
MKGESVAINYKANLAAVTVMVGIRCKPRRRPLFFASDLFGERQMVIWLDSNSNLCAKKMFSSMEFVVVSAVSRLFALEMDFFFLFEKKSKAKTKSRKIHHHDAG